MTASDYIVEVLGGPSVFKGRAAPTSLELRARIKEGLPYRSLESIRERLRLTVAEVLTILDMPTRTVARRRQAGKLNLDESDRLYRIAHVVGHAVSVFGAEERATTWQRRPNRALNGDLPIRLLDTDVGAREVEDILGQIEHGIVG